MERILATPSFMALIREFGRERVKSALGEHLALLRHEREPWDAVAAEASVRRAAAVAVASGLRRVVNGSGVIIHTNLGRAPVDPAIWAAAEEIVTGYSNLEFDLGSGERGARDEHLSALCNSLFGCEAALLTNNNAAGILLLLAATAARREVIVSRGELVEIGGAFRVPDVIGQGGATLREVGTTNRTRASDYESAAGRKTAALLRVHRSNFDLVGFVETPSVDELVEVARRKRLPLFYDEGSGRIVDLTRYGFGSDETLRSLVTRGVDALTCSTDKLIGASQGGLILGTRDIIESCRRHPLMRAVRAGKESYAVIAATLRAFATGQHEQLVSLYRMLATPLAELRARASAITEGSDAVVVDSRCALGGGTTPAETISSVAVHVPGNPNELQGRFLAHDPPIVGRVVDDRFTIEVRTLSGDDVAVVRAAVRGRDE